MVKIKWTLFALQDIDDIATFIAKDSPHYAKLFVTKIFEKVKPLQDFPKTGRKVPEFNDENIRELIFGNYRIVYKLFQQHLEILTVHHSARLLSDSSLFE